MPDLAEQIRTVIDAGSPSITADEVMHRNSQTSYSTRSLRPPLRRIHVARLGRGAAVAWAGLVAVVVVALVVGVGLATLPHGSPNGGAPPTPRTLTTRSFALGVDRVTFAYPSVWETHQYLEDQSSFSLSVVFVASQALHDPCTTTHSTPPGPVESRVCVGYAVDRLDPDGVYLVWSRVGAPRIPGQSVKHPGSPITVGGQPGIIDVQRPGTCSSIGGDESIDLIVDPDASNNWIMQACLRGPDLGQVRFSDPRLVEIDALQPCEPVALDDQLVGHGWAEPDDGSI